MPERRDVVLGFFLAGQRWRLKCGGLVPITKSWRGLCTLPAGQTACVPATPHRPLKVGLLDSFLSLHHHAPDPARGPGP
jgi:hypothetical protein